MKHRLISWIIACLLLSYFVNAQAVDRPRGVAKSMAKRYQATDEWTCLDGSKTIPVTAINDDYCDCPDGSDEPGTSACPNGRFHCTNAGHKPAYIRSSQVNDGICEPECCDGSDEWDSGVKCPNWCKALGAEARKREKEEARIRTEGLRIKSEYVKYGEQRKKELKANLERLKIELFSAQEKEAQLKKELDRVEMNAAASEERKKNSATYIRIQEYKNAISTLQEQMIIKQARLDTLTNILTDLKNGYNPNGQDMAVKSAVMGFEEYEKEHAEAEEEEEVSNDFGNLASEDWVPEEFYGASEEGQETISLIYRLEEYIPEAFHEYYSYASELLLEVLVQIGLLKESAIKRSVAPSETKEMTEAREAYQAAEKERQEYENQITEAENEQNSDFGPREEWRKLNKECLEINTGEYTYSVCLFDKAEQKSNNDYRTTHLGNFASFTGPGSKGEAAFYTKQKYEHGARCWNGPERSVQLQFECGIENKILTVVEPEKCEYLFKLTSPAICQEGDETANTSDSQVHVKDEL